MSRAGIRIRRLTRRLAPLGWAALVGVAAIAYVGITSVAQASTRAYLHPSDFLEPRGLDVLIFGWALWMAASVGSFLNVVAYRVPRGLSVQGRSHCPRCQYRLSFRDNLPIFGWIFLRGRCRRCRLPISPRYPIVETAVGLSIAVVIFARIYQWALPHESSPFDWSNLNTPRFDDPMDWALAAYHTFALVFAWTLGLMRFDGQKLPPRMTTAMLVVLAIPLIGVPSLMIVSWRQLSATAVWFGDGLYVDGLMRVISATVAAAMIGRSVARRTSPHADLKLDPLGQSTRRLVDLIALLMPVTLILGWQTALASVSVTVLLASIAQRRFQRGDADSYWRDPLSAMAVTLPVTTSIQLVFWKTTHGFGFWPSDVSSPLTVIAWAIGLLCVTSLLIPQPPPARPTTVWSDDEDDDEGNDDGNDERDSNDDQEDVLSESPDSEPGAIHDAVGG